MGDQNPHSNQHLFASRHFHESVASSLGASVFVLAHLQTGFLGAAEIHWRGCSHQGSSAKGRADVSPAAEMGRQIRGGGIGKIAPWLLRCRHHLPEDARSSTTGDAVIVTIWLKVA